MIVLLVNLDIQALSKLQLDFLIRRRIAPGEHRAIEVQEDTAKRTVSMRTRKCPQLSPAKQVQLVLLMTAC